MNWNLIEFCKVGNLDMVKLLIDNGANVRLYDNYALKLSIDNGHYEVVKLLLDNGADVYAYYDDIALWRVSDRHNKITDLLNSYMKEAS